MAKQSIRFILKNGIEFVMTCEKLKCSYSKLDGELTSVEYEGASANIPLYLDVSQVAAILQEKIETGGRTPDGH